MADQKLKGYCFFYKHEYPKVFFMDLDYAESKSDSRIPKFKMADPIWQIKSSKIVVFYKDF